MEDLVVRYFGCDGSAMEECVNMMVSRLGEGDGGVTIQDFVETLEPSLTSAENETRSRAMHLMYQIFRLSTLSLSSMEFHLFAVFFAHRLLDQATILPTLQSLKVLLDKYHQVRDESYQDNMIVLENIRAVIDRAAWPYSTRQAVGDVLISMVKMDSPKLELSIILDIIIRLLEEEKDPRILFVAFRLLAVIIQKSVDLFTTEVCNSLTDILFRYFPITFRSSLELESGTIVSQSVLFEAWNAVICDNEILLSYSLPFLFDQINEGENLQSRVDAIISLQRIVCNFGYKALDVLPANEHTPLKQIGEIIYSIALNEGSDSILQANKQLLSTVSFSICKSCISSGTDDDWQQFQDIILGNVIKEIQRGSETMKARQAWRLCVALASSGGSFSMSKVVNAIVPTLLPEVQSSLDNSAAKASGQLSEPTHMIYSLFRCLTNDVNISNIVPRHIVQSIWQLYVSFLQRTTQTLSAKNSFLITPSLASTLIYIIKTTELLILSGHLENKIFIDYLKCLLVVYSRGSMSGLEISGIGINGEDEACAVLSTPWINYAPVLADLQTTIRCVLLSLMQNSEVESILVVVARLLLSRPELWREEHHPDIEENLALLVGAIAGRCREEDLLACTEAIVEIKKSFSTTSELPSSGERKIMMMTYPRQENNREIPSPLITIASFFLERCMMDSISDEDVPVCENLCRFVEASCQLLSIEKQNEIFAILLPQIHLALQRSSKLALPRVLKFFLVWLTHLDTNCYFFSNPSTSLKVLFGICEGATLFEGSKTVAICLGVLMNKISDTASISAAFDSYAAVFRNLDFTVLSLDSAKCKTTVSAFLFMVKGLMMRPAKDYVIQSNVMAVLESFFDCRTNPNGWIRAALLAERFHLLISGDALQNSGKFNISPFRQQKLFSSVFSLLKKLMSPSFCKVKIESSAEFTPAELCVLVMFGHLYVHTKLSSILNTVEGSDMFIYLFVSLKAANFALNDFGSKQNNFLRGLVQSLQLSVLRSVRIAMDGPTALSKLLFENLPDIMQFMQKVAELESSGKVKLALLSCLRRIPARISHPKLFQYRKDVLKLLGRWLDDEKRIIRTEAAEVRSLWFLIK
eukprot:gene1316-1437_t